MEISSKKPVTRFRDVVQFSKRQERDPRFDNMGGGVDKDVFRRRYRFLYDEQLPTEKKQLQSQLSREKNGTKKEQLQRAIQRIDQQLRTETETRKRQTHEQSVKRQEREAVAEGKRPFYLKKADKRKLLLVEKFKELKKAGRLDKYLEKKRKKNASKDHRFLPSTRRTMDE